mgnify:CR=1 FL=1
MLEDLLSGMQRGLRRPAKWLEGVLAGVPLESLRDLARTPDEWTALAQLEGSFLGVRFLLPILLAREIGLFEALGDQPRTVRQLARECGVVEEGCRSLVRVLESQRLLDVDGQTVCLTDFGGRALSPERKSSLLPVLDLLATYVRNFSEMVAGLRSGDTPAELDVTSDQDGTDRLLRAVNAYLEPASREFVQKAELPEIEHFIVGSMGVSFSAELLRERSAARVTYGCLSHLVERIPGLRDDYGVDPVRVVDTHRHSGEPADDSWGADDYDLVFLTRKMILEPENETGLKFARKARQVLRPGGVAVFWEAIHPDNRTSPLGLSLETSFDLGMSPTAPLKTESEFTEICDEVGFEDVDFVSCLGGATSFAVAWC